MQYCNPAILQNLINKDDNTIKHAITTNKEQLYRVWDRVYIPYHLADIIIDGLQKHYTRLEFLLRFKLKDGNDFYKKMVQANDVSLEQINCNVSADFMRDMNDMIIIPYFKHHNLLCSGVLHVLTALKLCCFMCSVYINPKYLAIQFDVRKIRPSWLTKNQNDLFLMELNYVCNK